MSTVGGEHNADFGRQCRKIVTARISTRAAVTPQQLDSAILAALHESGGDVVAWSELRDRLPRAPYWRKTEALVRLHQTGAVLAVKFAGRTFVSLPVAVAVP